MNTFLCFAVALTGLLVFGGLSHAESGTPLIPRRVLFGNPDKAAPQISPDGANIAYLAPVEGVLNLWVGPADQPQAARPVTQDAKRGIHTYFWAYTNRHIIYLQDRDGDENWRVYSLDLESRKVRNLTPVEGVQARVQEVSYRFPEEILVGLNDRNPQLHDIYRVNIETGARSLVLENEGYLGFMADDRYQVRLGFRVNPEGEMTVIKFSAEAKPEPLLSIGPEDLLIMAPWDGLVGFDKAGNVVYMKDSRGRNTAALVKLSLDTTESTPVAEDPRVDISGVMIHPTEKTIQAYSTNYTREEWHPVEEGMADHLAKLRGLADGDFSVVSRTLDDRKWLVAYTMDNGPVRYYLYERESQQATFLFTDRSQVEGLALAHMHPVVIEARDGLELVSYLTLPVGTDPDGDGRPARPVPLVVEAHGGPHDRFPWGFDILHQLLADRGYAVLAVNFRGSTGFGKQFINAAKGEWGGKMHDDLIDAVNWAVREGIADPQRVAITGGSYGGYATLIGVTRTPDVFACGVAKLAISNLVTLFQNLPSYWVPFLPMVQDLIGADPETEEGRAFLLERSPLTHVDRISKPLLIGQGANDPRTPPEQSDQIVQAMQERGIPVTYLLYRDEGHGFVRPENNLSFWAVAEAFLAQHLGGRFEPIGNDFEGAMVEVLAGADQVPGLAARVK